MIQGRSPKKYSTIIKREFGNLQDRDVKIDDQFSLLDRGSVQNFKLVQPVGVVMSASPVDGLSEIKSYLTFQVIDALLSGMRYPSGLLHTRLRGEQLVYVVHALPMRLLEQDLLFIYALTDSENVERVNKIISQTIKDLKTSITEEQFELAKSQVLFNIQNTLQNMNSKQKEIIHQINRYNQVVGIKQLEEGLNSIEIKDVTNAVKLFLKKNLTIFSLIKNSIISMIQ